MIDITVQPVLRVRFYLRNKPRRCGWLKSLMYVFEEVPWIPQPVTSQLIILNVTLITPFHLPLILLPGNPLAISFCRIIIFDYQ